MTDETITVEQIEVTETFKSLSKTQQSFCTKRNNRKLLTNALIIKLTTGVTPGTIFNYNVGILNELAIGKSGNFEQSKN